MVLYDTIEQAIRTHENYVIAQQTTPHEVRNAIRWVMRNNPDIFWFAHQYHLNEKKGVIQFQYTFSKKRVEFIRQSIDDVMQNDFYLEKVKTLKIHEQVSYVYKWLIAYCSYNVNSAYNQSVYSVFVRRNSVCTGYAKSAQYLFNLLGIESSLVFGRLHNDKEDGRHCWNLIKIDDQYYHFDACLGDSILDGVTLKAGAQELFKINAINYNFLCVSTEEILETRSIEDITTLPECPYSWPKDLIKILAKVELKQRKGIKGCLLSNIGSSADIHLCSKDKNTVLKVFRSNNKTTSLQEYHFMQQTKGCQHLLQCNEQYTYISQNIIAIEQLTPIVDLLYSHYYELSLKGLIKIATDVATAWKECQEHGVLYRDIHVCNIYRANDGTFKLGDFGSCTNDFDIKETVGNQWFMAPETYVSGIFTETSAVYSISMIMYFILNNLRPAFWKLDCENDALRKRMDGYELPTPIVCVNLPPHIKEKLDKFFKHTSALLPKERISSITEFIYELERLTYYCGVRDYIIHYKGIGSDLVLDAGNDDRLDTRWNFISRYIYNTVIPSPKSRIRKYNTCIKDISHVDEVENFARTMASNPTDPSNLRPLSNMTEDVETYATTAMEFESYRATYSPQIHHPKLAEEITEKGKRGMPLQSSIFSRIIGVFYKRKKSKKYINQLNAERSEVYSSIFAPAEVKRKSHLQIQIYLHLYDETEKVKSLARESDKNAERRDYIPLSLKLKKGDKVDIEFNVYGESRLMSERKSIIWQGSFTKCSFDYFVPKNIDVDELSCEANLFVNGAMIGEMRFIIQIVDTPRNINPEILCHRFNKIFISYAHQDAPQIRLIALAYKAQGVDYFYDRDSLNPGDVYDEKIFDYIDRSDLFILCWSKNAAASEYVAKEKDHALLRAYPQLSLKDATLKICPVSIEPRAELPSDMKEIYNFEVL